MTPSRTPRSPCWRALRLTALLALAGPAAAATPALPDLSDAERARLRAGEVVVQHDLASARMTSLAMALVTVPPDVAWRAFLDVQARVAENPTLIGVDAYRTNSPSDFYLRFRMSFFGVRIDVPNHFTCDHPHYTCTYTLDHDQPADVQFAEGWWLLAPSPDGWILAFDSVSEVGRFVPGWAAKMLAEESMAHLVGSIRDRAAR